MEAIRRLTALFSVRKGGSAATTSPISSEKPSSAPSPLLPPLSEIISLEDGREARIRLLEHRDGALLYEHVMSMSEESRRLFCPYPYERLQAEAIAADAHNKDYLRLLALVGEKCAGYAYFTTRNAKSGFPMVGIGVTDEFQGVGLGHALMDYLIAEAKARGFKGLDLTVFKDNYRAQRLYASLGFAFTGEADWGRQYSMRLWFAKGKLAAGG